MKKKLILSVVLLSLSSSVYADTIVERKVVPRRSAIQSTNMVFSDSQYSVNKNTLDTAINELQNKISADTDNYALYASLANLYIKAKQYNNAYDELVFLNHLASKDLLDKETLSEVSEIKNAANAQDALTDQAKSQIDTMYGVDLNEELADLIKYQRAYEASARLVNVANELMQIIIGLGQ